ncbi:MAG: site-specific DNA-methyltransferase [Sphaerochaeta sp.]|jgi:DNA modification methylase|nr:site-specific DNA-methyltransferase [Sphaerochaeta sp.]
MIYYQDSHVTVHQGDAKEVLEYLPPESVDCCITSPPYWGLRDYKANGQLGLEKTPEEYVDKMVQVFHEVRRVLKKEGTCWLNLGDSYGSGGKKTNHAQPVANGNECDLPCEDRGKQGFSKQLIGIPWRCAFALQADGWWLRQDIIWSKPNPMPESVTDRCTKSHEYIFLLSKSAKYYYDQQAILEPITETSRVRLSEDIDNQIGSTRIPGKTNGNMKAVSRKMNGDNCKIGGNGTGFQGHSGNYDLEGNLLGNPLGRNKRSVWEITTKPYKEAHFATFPPDLVQPMVMAGCPINGVVLDPFAGSGTTLQVAKKLNRRAIGIEIKPEYCDLIIDRCRQQVMELGV